MSEQTETQQAPQQPSPAEMFFRYVTALAQAAGAQAFTFAVAFPKADGTSGVLSTALCVKDAAPAWKAEIAKLLATNATQSAVSLAAPDAPAQETPAA